MDVQNSKLAGIACALLLASAVAMGPGVAGAQTDQQSSTKPQGNHQHKHQHKHGEKQQTTNEGQSAGSPTQGQQAPKQQ